MAHQLVPSNSTHTFFEAGLEDLDDTVKAAASTTQQTIT